MPRAPTRNRSARKGDLIALSQNRKPDENLIKALEKGYKEMADINLELAQMCLEADNECLSQCEEKLTECE